MTDQQFYQVRAGQLAAQQAARGAQNVPDAMQEPAPQATPTPVPSPTPAQATDPVAPIGQELPKPALLADEGDEQIDEDEDARVAREWAEMAAGDDHQTGENDENDPDGADTLPDLAIDTDDEDDPLPVPGEKKRFRILGRKSAGAGAGGPGEKAKRTRKEKPPKLPRRRAGWLTWVLWILFVVMVAALAAGILLFPTKVTSIWSPTRHLYDRLGMDVPPPLSPDDAGTDGGASAGTRGGNDKAGPAATKSGTGKSAGKSSGRDGSDDSKRDADEDPKNKVGLSLEVANVRKRSAKPGKTDVSVELYLKNISRRTRIVPPVRIKFIDVNGETVFERRVDLLTGPVSPGKETHTRVQIKNVPVSAMHLAAEFDVPGAATN